MTPTQFVIEAVAQTIKRLYPEATVYQDDQEQGITEPCFFISVVGANGHRAINSQHQRKIPLQIACLGWTRAEVVGVAETLLLELELLPTAEADKPPYIHGSDLSYTPVDSDVHLSVTYKLNYQEIIDRPPMEELKLIPAAE